MKPTGLLGRGVFAASRTKQSEEKAEHDPKNRGSSDWFCRSLPCCNGDGLFTVHQARHVGWRRPGAR